MFFKYTEVDFGDDTPTKSSEVEVDSKNGEVGTKFFNIDGGQVSIFIFWYR